ncbi:hypothetical protein JRO89_XS03G0293300 [Xanthoceras sorbifolium]|uniref:PGG domain-containing protein n=1 Tax=Xanthoceras sorbifolium TaxID=99658 RepID=A0ABQ8ICN0_9ROSI|nr:hypothetical protein JRO89_XS03G0293300 [Xanthoceras sorbifolium]
MYTEHLLGITLIKENMERRIYDAAVQGSVTALLNLLQEDSLALDRFMVGCYAETPLHIASMLGHLQFVQEIRNLKPELSGELDSWKSSPLHLATAKGYLDIVKILVSANAEMCFSRDRDGRNPLLIAAIKGHPYTKVQAIKFLTSKKTMQVNALNAYGLTALDVLTQSYRDVKDWDIGELLRDAGAMTGKTINEVGSSTDQTPRTSFTSRENHQTITGLQSPAGNRKRRRRWANFRRRQNGGNRFDQTRGALMVVASLIATMAFQVGVNPPGGVWQEDSSGAAPAPGPAFRHFPGVSILESTLPGYFTVIWACNTTGFVASLIIILLLISGLPFKCRCFMWILRFIMWFAVCAMALTYVFSVLSTTDHFKAPYARTAPAIILTITGLIGILLLGHIIHAIVKIIKCFIRLITRTGTSRRQQHSSSNIDDMNRRHYDGASNV